MSEVRVERLSKSYSGVHALDEVSLTFPDGGFFGLLGPSGSGKTTLLRAIAGFVTLDHGHVSIDEQPVEHVPVEAREIGMVFQSYALFPNMTVADNIGFGLRVRKLDRAEEARQVAQALELVQLDALGARKPHELSGGQRQRVAMARAIVTKPRVLLLDEPLSALDKALRVDMQIELKRIQREVGITTIFVTHDQEEALTLSDRIGILREGKLIRHGTPQEVYADPQDVFTARFLGEANILQGKSDNGQLRLKDGSSVYLPSDCNDGDHNKLTTIGVRPEHLVVTAEKPQSDNAVQASMRQRIFAGAMGTCILEWEDHTLKATAKFEEYQQLPDSGPVWISWSNRHTRVLRD